MSELRLILFDFDGTLVDSAGDVVTCMKGAFADHGLEVPTAADVKSIIGLSLPVAVAAIVDNRGAPRLSEAGVEAVVASYKRRYRGALAAGETNETLFPHIEAMLSALDRPSTLLGIATGKSRHGLDRLLALHGLSAHFVTTVTADDAASKPAPEMIHIATAATGVPANRTVMVGDSTYDILMANAAGTPALGVSWGYFPPDKLRAAGAQEIAGTVMDIPRLVDAICPP